MASSCYSTIKDTFKADLGRQSVVHKLHPAANTTKRHQLLFYSTDGYKTTLDLECFQIICNGNLCK